MVLESVLWFLFLAAGRWILLQPVWISVLLAALCSVRTPVWIRISRRLSRARWIFRARRSYGAARHRWWRFSWRRRWWRRPTLTAISFNDRAGRILLSQLCEPGVA